VAQLKERFSFILMKRIVIGLILVVAPVAVFAGDAAAGKAIFDAKCKGCHGAAGAGGVMDKESIVGKTATEAKVAVQKGKGKMKPLASVTGDALESVAAYVASLKK
jgi:mono/diheme cytochrome c family protein